MTNQAAVEVSISANVMIDMIKAFCQISTGTDNGWRAGRSTYQVREVAPGTYSSGRTFSIARVTKRGHFGEATFTVAPDGTVTHLTGYRRLLLGLLAGKAWML